MDDYLVQVIDTDYRIEIFREGWYSCPSDYWAGNYTATDDDGTVDFTAGTYEVISSMKRFNPKDVEEWRNELVWCDRMMGAFMSDDVKLHSGCVRHFFMEAMILHSLIWHEIWETL